MADLNEGQPIRTLTNNDVVIRGADSAGTLLTFAKEDGNLASIKTNSDTLAAWDSAGRAQVDIQSNAAINVAQVGGTAVDTDAGNSSTGTLRVVIASDQTEIPVNVDGTDKTNVFDYSVASAVAGAGGTGTHTYTPGANMFAKRIVVSGTGMWKAEIQYGTTGAEATIAVLCARAGGETKEFVLDDPLSVTTAQSIKIVKTNREPGVGDAQDLYSTVSGYLA